MAIAMIDTEVAKLLDLPSGPYSTNDGLALEMLNAMIRRGWRPSLDYDEFTGFWHVMLRHGSTTAFHHVFHVSIARAIVRACLEAL